MEEYEFEAKPRRYRVARFYRNGKMSYDLFMNLSDKKKSVSATKIREIAEDCTQSEFAVVVEDEERGKYEVQLWTGQKDSVGGVMQSRRVIDKNVDASIAHLFISECSVNCFAIKNNSEVVAQIVERVLDFAKQQGNKPEKSL